MAIEESFGPQLREFDRDGVQTAIKDRYQQELTQFHRLRFPDAALQRVIDWSEAFRNWQRGDLPVTDDGDTVELRDQNVEENMELLEANSELVLNGNKLRSLARFAVISWAGSAATNSALVESAAENLEASDLRTLSHRFKHFVRTAMTIEQWGAPWLAIATRDLMGKSQDFPLRTAAELQAANNVLYDGAFRFLRSRHFRLLPNLRIAIRSYLDMVTPDILVTPAQQTLVTKVALHHLTSPDAARAALEQLIADGSIPEYVNWSEYMRVASDRLKHHFGQ